MWHSAACAAPQDVAAQQALMSGLSSSSVCAAEAVDRCHLLAGGCAGAAQPRLDLRQLALGGQPGDVRLMQLPEPPAIVLLQPFTLTLPHSDTPIRQCLTWKHRLVTLPRLNNPS